MRTLIIASLFSFFLVIVVIGALSVTPILESSLVSHLLAQTYNRNTSEEQLSPDLTSVAVSDQRTESSSRAADLSPLVLGLQTGSTSISLATLYGLINGDRRDQHSAVLQVHHLLEKAAEEIHQNRSHPELAVVDDDAVLKQSGYSARTFTILTATAIESDWAAIKFWQQDPRQSLLLRSNAFSEMGLSVLCDVQRASSCSVLLILASP